MAGLVKLHVLCIDVGKHQLMQAHNQAQGLGKGSVAPVQ